MKRFCLYFLLLSAVVSCQSKGETTNTNTPEGVTTLENPFIHTVYIWFKEGITDEQKAQMYADTEGLREIEVVRALYTGKPADTDRPIVERSYDYAIVVHFEDLAAHDSYQQHPTHLALLENHSALWERVMITDIQH